MRSSVRGGAWRAQTAGWLAACGDASQLDELEDSTPHWRRSSGGAVFCDPLKEQVSSFTYELKRTLYL